MTEIIAVANAKGGSAKTTTAVNLCCALAATGRKVLLVDLDPQCSATVAVGFEHNAEQRSLAGVLISGNDLSDVLLHYVKGSFDVIPSGEDLTAVPVALYNEPDGIRRLRHALVPVAGEYDFIFIDCPPSLSVLTKNALCASNYLLIPMVCDYFAIDSLMSLVSLYEQLNQSGEARVQLLGVVRTLFEEEHPLSRQISRELQLQFKGLLFDTLIPYNERISESTSAGRPVMLYDKSSVGARAYLTLAGELLRKLRHPQESSDQEQDGQSA